MGNQTVDGPHIIFVHTMEVNAAHQLFGYPYSSKYLLLRSTGLKQH